MFVRFTIHPSDRKELEAEAGKAGGDPAEMHTVVDHKVWERARIELIKV